MENDKAFNQTYKKPSDVNIKNNIEPKLQKNSYFPFKSQKNLGIFN